MRKVIFISVLFFFFSLFAVFPVWAATRQLSGVVRDNDGNPLVNAKIVIVDTASRQEVGNTVTDPFGNYTIPIPDGTYDITLVPPEESGIPKSTESHVTIASDMMYDISANPKPIVANTLKSVPIPFLVGILFVIVVFFGFLFVKNRK